MLALQSVMGLEFICFIEPSGPIHFTSRWRRKNIRNCSTHLDLFFLQGMLHPDSTMILVNPQTKIRHFKGHWLRNIICLFLEVMFHPTSMLKISFI